MKRKEGRGWGREGGEGREQASEREGFGGGGGGRATPRPWINDDYED